MLDKRHQVLLEIVFEGIIRRATDVRIEAESYIK